MRGEYIISPLDDAAAAGALGNLERYARKWARHAARAPMPLSRIWMHAACAAGHRARALWSRLEGRIEEAGAWERASEKELHAARGGMR